MFGDIMHGALLAIFAIWLCFSKRAPGTLGETFGQARYLFLLMGLFSFYCGLIYNDFTSMTTQIFGPSCYSSEGLKPDVGKHTVTATKADDNCVYPVGIDPVWFRTTQEISFMNSFKMKTSVIFGVCQMTLGTMMKGANAIYFRRYSVLIFEVFTQIALLMALFGFMDFMIIVKWLTNWDPIEKETGEKAPALIKTMIVMFINQGNKPPPQKGQAAEADVIGNQSTVMHILLITALVTVPLMLLVNPCIESR
jgi:V-type H+-transporting ATPase subunit a